MFDYLRTDDAMLDALCIVAMSRSIVFCIVCIDNTLAIQNSTPMISGAAIALGYRLRVSPRCRPPSIWYRLYSKPTADCIESSAISHPQSGKIS